MDYGQFCPVAKASELLAEKWTPLIIRELLLGSHRFAEFQRAMARMSPSLLAKRLKQLEAAGILTRKRQHGRRGYDYYLTPAGKELEPIIEHLAKWGMRWARGQLTERELDIEFLMWDVRRRLQLNMLPDGETTLCFLFDDLAKFKSWWLVIRKGEVDLCTEDPGTDVDLYVSTTSRHLVQIWHGDISTKEAMRQRLLRTHGDSKLARTMPDWLGICLYADVRPAGADVSR